MRHAEGAAPRPLAHAARRHRHEARRRRRSVIASPRAALLVRRVRRWAVVGAVVGGAVVSAPGLVHAEPTTVTTLPIDMVVWVPCADDGAGEPVHLTGTVQVVTHTVQRSATEWLRTTHFNPQGVEGVGLATGDRYRGTGSTATTEIVSEAGLRSSRQNVFRVVGPGPGNDLRVHETWHTTVAPDGSLVGTVDHVSVECA